MDTFGTRLRALRQNANLSQNELARQLKISKSSINMYERGEREPGFETMEAIADYFNVDMDYLYGRSEEKSAVKRAFDKIFLETKVTNEAMAFAMAHASRGIFSLDEKESAAIPPADQVRIEKAFDFLKIFLTLSEDGVSDVDSYVQFVAQKEK